MALDTASQIVALATHGSIHPEHFHCINLNDLKRIIKDEVGLLANHRPPHGGVTRGQQGGLAKPGAGVAILRPRVRSDDHLLYLVVTHPNPP